MTPDIVSYGILERTSAQNDIESAIEDIATLGFAVLNAGFTSVEINSMSLEFDKVLARYHQTYGVEYLEARDEQNTIRLPLIDSQVFLNLALNSKVLAVISGLITGKFILNQQNGILNPAGKRYNQDAWHRDLPYQHFVSSRPIAINALYCVDEFTQENGATHVLPATHKKEAFPSEHFVEKHGRQIAAPAGSFIIIDCMTYHRGGANRTNKNRRAVNHVYTIPYLKQQISIPTAMDGSNLSEHAKELLGFKYQVPDTVHDYLNGRNAVKKTG